MNEIGEFENFENQGVVVFLQEVDEHVVQVEAIHLEVAHQDHVHLHQNQNYVIDPERQDQCHVQDRDHVLE